MKRLLYILLPFCFAACTLIDDDLSVCGEDVLINYQLQLHTELSVQLQTELTEEPELPIRQALKDWLTPVFTDKAKDIDLRFYSAETDDIRHQIQDEINDNRTSYTIYLPKENYMHLAVANIADNREVRLSGGEHSQTMLLSVTDKPEVAPLNTGLFTARLPMAVNDTTLHFDVHLYMVNSAVALVIDTTECTDLTDIRGGVLDGASQFSVKDSVFLYTDARTFLFEKIYYKGRRASSGAPMHYNAYDSPYRCLATVCMPTPDNKEWHVTFTATLTGNRHTTTTLTIGDALKAGTLRILRCRLGKNGGLRPEESDSEVGASVKLDWNEGGDHEIEI